MTHHLCPGCRCVFSSPLGPSVITKCPTCLQCQNPFHRGVFSECACPRGLLLGSSGGGGRDGRDGGAGGASGAGGAGGGASGLVAFISPAAAATAAAGSPPQLSGPTVEDSARVVTDLAESLFADEEKDVTFELADGQERAHKAVLRAASEVWGGMFASGMRESSAGTVTLPDVGRTAMRVFLRLLYTGHVDAADWAAHRAAEAEAEAAGKAAAASAVAAAAAGAKSSSSSSSSAATAAAGCGATVDAEGATADGADSAGGGASGGASDAEAPPLDVLLTVASLAKRYMVAGVLSLAVQALKARLQVAKGRSDLKTFEAILAAAVAVDLGTVRMVALDLAKSFDGLRELYDKRSLRPEVQFELEAIWPMPKGPERKRARLA